MEFSPKKLQRKSLRLSLKRAVDDSETFNTIGELLNLSFGMNSPGSQVEAVVVKRGKKQVDMACMMLENRAQRMITSEKEQYKTRWITICDATGCIDVGVSMNASCLTQFDVGAFDERERCLINDGDSARFIRLRGSISFLPKQQENHIPTFFLNNGFITDMKIEWNCASAVGFPGSFPLLRFIKERSDYMESSVQMYFTKAICGMIHSLLHVPSASGLTSGTISICVEDSFGWIILNLTDDFQYPDDIAVCDTAEEENPKLQMFKCRHAINENDYVIIRGNFRLQKTLEDRSAVLYGNHSSMDIINIDKNEFTSFEDSLQKMSHSMFHYALPEKIEQDIPLDN